MSIPLETTVLSFSPYWGFAAAIISRPTDILNIKYLIVDLLFENPLKILLNVFISAKLKIALLFLKELFVLLN